MNEWSYVQEQQLNEVTCCMSRKSKVDQSQYFKMLIEKPFISDHKTDWNWKKLIELLNERTLAVKNFNERFNERTS